MIYYDEYRGPSDLISLRDVEFEAVYDSIVYQGYDPEEVLSYLKENLDNVNTYIIKFDDPDGIDAYTTTQGIFLYKYIHNGTSLHNLIHRNQPISDMKSVFRIQDFKPNFQHRHLDVDECYQYEDDED